MPVSRLVQAIILVEDLNVARQRMTALGFATEDGGRHPGRGTANLIVPFGDEYLELLAVVDAREARASRQGRPVLDALSRRGPGLARWSVESSDIEATAGRLGLPVERRQRIRPDAETVHWRAVGVDEAWAQPWRCAFMAWDDPWLHPARRGTSHPNGALGFAALEVSVPSEAELVSWIGEGPPPKVEVRTGPDVGPGKLVVSTASGQLEID
jgi:hypothetical protein